MLQQAAAALVLLAGLASRRVGSSAQGEEPRSPAPGGVLTGQVLEAGTGRPLPRMKVRVMIRRIPTGFMIYGGDEIQTDAEGKFRSEIPAPGPYVVFATGKEGPDGGALPPATEAPRFGRAFRPLQVEDPAEGTIECAISLGPPATVRARVTTEKGDAVAGAAVVALCDDAPHPIQFMDSVATDERGRAELVGLGEGSWRLLVSKEGAGVAIVDLLGLKWGEKRDLDVKLGPCGDLYLGVQVPGAGTDEHALSVAMCEVYDEKGRLVSLGPLTQVVLGARSIEDVPRSKADPAFLFAGSYVPGRYGVVVRAQTAHGDPGEASHFHLIEKSTEFFVEAGQETRVRVTLPAHGPAGH